MSSRLLALADLGAEFHFTSVAIQPGKPLVFGTCKGKPVFGLPGNPISTMVTFELFVRPAIRRLMGQPLPFRRTVPVRLAEPVTLGPPLRHYLRVAIEPDSPPRARLTGPRVTPPSRSRSLPVTTRPSTGWRRGSW